MRIFISTDATLHGIFNTDAGIYAKLLSSNLSLLKANDIVYYNFKEGKFDTATATSSIIIVKDNSTNELQDIKSDTDFMLHHSKTDEHQTNVVSKFSGQKRSGAHSQNDNDFYKPVFKIIFGNNTDKVNEILKTLGFSKENYKLEALIRLNKSLALLPLKGKWLEDAFKTAKQALEKSDNIKSANDRLAGIAYKENVTEFLEQLKPIETEIINLSAVK